MQIMVDTSVWINLFKKNGTDDVVRLKNFIREDEELLLGDLILAEILQGVRTKKELAEINSAFSTYPVIPLVGETISRESANYYRQLRSQGTTVRKTIDCLIATWCIHNRIPLLHNDRDFVHFIQFGLIEV